MGHFVDQKKEIPKADKIEHSVNVISETKNDTIQEKNNSDCVGLDVGTMNLVSAKLNNNQEIQTKNIRNVFIEIEKENITNIDLSQIHHVEIDDIIYILGEDAYKFANMFNIEVNRPMSKGMISNKNIDSAEILAVMVRELIGSSKNKDNCCYSIPANPIDDIMNVIYHENVFGRIISSLGFNPIPLNEAAAIILSECSNENFSGVGISFGAGMTNIGLVYKSIPIFTFSLARGGDWIDYNTAISIGAIPNRVNSIKEKKSFSLVEFPTGKKKEKRIKEALVYYYNNLINYTLKNIVKKLDETDVELPDELPIIVSGGTSKVNGFIDLVKQQLTEIELPFDVNEIRTAENQLTAVAKGCLIHSMK